VTLAWLEGVRIAVTGGAGFIGSHLVDRAVADGAAVLVVDDLSTGRRDQVDRRAELVEQDLLTADLDRLFGDWQPVIVFHLAAQASVARSSQEPLRDLAMNVAATHRVAAAAAAAGARRLVFVSSGGAVYGERTRPATEGTLPAPASYYGVHKLAAEGHVRLAGIPWAVARLSNVYGPRQAAGLEGAVVASFVDQARAGGPLLIHGDGSQTRDFLHVSDAVDALIRLGRPAERVGTWNVAAGDSVAIAELADLIDDLGAGPLGRTYGPRRPGDVRASAVDARRVRALGWRPTVSLREGLAALLRGG
jgi:UDP-glucose 4-epimerase